MIRRGWSKTLHRFLTIQDTPESIARGVGMGLFLGFTPFFGLKTLLSLICAILVRGNKLSALIAVSLHDLFLPFMPAIFRFEYVLGYWIVNEPHRFPPSLRQYHFRPHELLSWTTFFTLGVPLTIGSIIVGFPVSLLGYWLVRKAVTERRRLAAAIAKTTEACDSPK